MFVLSEQDNQVLRAANNIPNVEVTYADVLCTYDVVAKSKLYITKDAIKKLEEAYK
jgi:ribosomal protein L4